MFVVPIFGLFVMALAGANPARATSSIAVVSPSPSPSASSPAAASPAPKYGPSATRLFHSQDYVRKHRAPDFWAMIPYYIPQFNNKSCSIASAVMVLNAARAPQMLGAADELVTQSGLLKKVTEHDWAGAVSDTGKGATLGELADQLKKSFETYGFKDVAVETISVNDLSPATKKRVHAALLVNEKSANDFIIANFIQAEFTGDPEGAVGHMAPVAAFDAEKKRVLIFDPDRQWYEPYWVSEESLLKGANTLDPVSGKNRGLLWVKIKR